MPPTSLLEKEFRMNLNRHAVLLPLLFCAVLLRPAAALPAAEEKPQRPCATDVEKFCKDVEPGGGAMMKCLKAHQNELSPECRERGEQLKEKVRDVRADCKADAERLCKDIRPGGGSIAKCLKKHESELSDACRQHSRSAKTRRRQKAD
jgi:Cysteine rich repeat